MIRRISTKWVLAVLAAVLVPFLGFAWFVNDLMAERLSYETVQSTLLSLASNLARDLDRELAERRLDIELWADDPVVELALAGSPRGEGELAERLVDRLDKFVQRSQSFDLVVAVDGVGRGVISNLVTPAGQPLPPRVLEALALHDFRTEDWFPRAIGGEVVLVDQHHSPFSPASGDPTLPENYHIGFAVPVRSAAGEGNEPAVLGLVFGLMNWGHIQHGILEPAPSRFFQGLLGGEIESSSYAWLWKSDADTIIGHPKHALIGQRVSEPSVALPQLVRAARDSTWGMYPEYEFGGVLKNAAFRHCAGPEDGGLGWVAGIGIDNSDIYATVNQLRRILYGATAGVVLAVVLWTIILARRTTAPISALREHTRHVASGELDARIPVTSQDELGELAQAFNNMTGELLDKREQLVRAEKDAAWREMARQVAHEIKNPLTPINLSMALMERAKRENSPEFDEIFERTVDLVGRQVKNMREIASDFHALAGASRKREVVDVGELVNDVLELNAAWAEDLDVSVSRGPAGAEPTLVSADPGALRRALINLVSNALEAMPGGGELSVWVQVERDQVWVEIGDTGKGLSPEVRASLFEPYFTTRTQGTGLGLAIVRRVVEELGGTISLDDGPHGIGVLARLSLPRVEPT
ncbi:MAG: ATP-binding protein [Planctomycetota bacterium]|jgi:signal transduction histidine kinase|nr:ATP-binding protein [Planctomycetota bacterium]